MKRAAKRLRYVFAGVVLILAIWISIDLFGSQTSDLREFDPAEVARLETAMWRSYYERHQVRMFFELTEILRTQYHVPLVRSNVIAFRAAKAAFLFKDGKQRSDYERALPDLVKFYAAIRRISSTPFDTNLAAKDELEWWILHREREKYGRDALIGSLADLQSVIYARPADQFMEHGKLRAEAMVLRDAKWESGHVQESDWAAIHESLLGSWRSLWMAVHQH
jgi:hypothetical protein